MNKMIKSLVLGVSITLLIGCAAQKVHPGAPDTIASTAFDTLIVVDQVIRAAKSENDAKNLSDSEILALNYLIKSYDIARVALLDYDNAIRTQGSNVAGYYKALSASLIDVTNAMAAFKKGVK